MLSTTQGNATEFVTLLTILIITPRLLYYTMLYGLLSVTNTTSYIRVGIALLLIYEFRNLIV